MKYNGLQKSIIWILDSPNRIGESHSSTLLWWPIPWRSSFPCHSSAHERTPLRKIHPWRCICLSQISNYFETRPNRSLRLGTWRYPAQPLHFCWTTQCRWSHSKIYTLLCRASFQNQTRQCRINFISISRYRNHVAAHLEFSHDIRPRWVYWFIG